MANLDLSLNAGPNLNNTIGMGAIANAGSPSNVDAQRGFNLSYIEVANSGNVAPNTDRTMVFAASAEAARRR